MTSSSSSSTLSSPSPDHSISTACSDLNDSRQTNSSASSRGPVNEHLLDHLCVDDELEIWWPLDRKYYPGRISARLASGQHRIQYDDGDVEHLFLPGEQWRFVGEAARRVTAALKKTPDIPLTKSIKRKNNLHRKGAKRLLKTMQHALVTDKDTLA